MNFGAITTYQELMSALAHNVPTNVLADTIRCIFPNPFQLMPPYFLSDKIKEIRNKIFEEKLLDKLPELAIMLEEDGCQDTLLIEHCKKMVMCQACFGYGCNNCKGYGKVPFKHYRGCWAL